MLVRVDAEWGRAHSAPSDAEVWEWVLRFPNAHVYLRGALALAMVNGSIADLTAIGWARTAIELWLEDIKSKAT